MEHRHFDAVVGGQGVHRLHDLSPDRGVQRVELLGTIERDDGNGAVLLEEDRLEAHGCQSLQS